MWNFIAYVLWGVTAIGFVFAVIEKPLVLVACVVIYGGILWICILCSPNESGKRHSQTMDGDNKY